MLLALGHGQRLSRSWYREMNMKAQTSRLVWMRRTVGKKMAVGAVGEKQVAWDLEVAATTWWMTRSSNTKHSREICTRATDSKSRTFSESCLETSSTLGFEEFESQQVWSEGRAQMLPKVPLMCCAVCAGPSDSKAYSSWLWMYKLAYAHESRSVFASVSIIEGGGNWCRNGSII